MLLVFSDFALGQTGEKNFIDQNFIEVTGKSEMKIVPDLIYIKIGISEKDTKNKISVNDLQEKMIEALMNMGIDVKKDLSVSDLLSNYRNKFLAKSDVILTKEFVLVVHDAKTANNVFAQLEKIDISNASIDHVDHTKIAELRNEVKVNAIKAARDKAESLTKAIGQGIGKAIYIQELDNFISPRVALSNTYAVHRGVSDKADDVDFDFEKIKLEYSILVRFELK